MAITPEKIDKVIKILTNKTPQYIFQWNPHYDDRLGDEFIGAHREYRIYYDDNHNKAMPEDFKHDFRAAISEMIDHFKKQKYQRKITNDYLQNLIDDLSDTINTYELTEIRGKKFQYQSKSTLWQAEENNRSYFSIDDIPDYWFKDVAESSQLKYDYTNELINGLKKILYDDNQIELDKMDLNVDEFIELILDHAPHYKDDQEQFYDDFGKLKTFLIIEYQNYKHPVDYYIAYQNRARKTLMHFRKEHASHNMTDELIEGYLNELDFEKNNFVMRNMNGKEYLCHKNAHFSSCYDLEDKKYQLEELKTERIIETIKLYNEYRYNILVYLIDGIEKLLKKPSAEVGHPEKLELKISISEIALLFRLLDEEGIINYKHKTEIYRYISSTLQSKNQKNISESSVKNKFLSPDNTAISNLDTLLINLRQKLKNI